MNVTDRPSAETDGLRCLPRAKAHDWRHGLRRKIQTRQPQRPGLELLEVRAESLSHEHDGAAVSVRNAGSRSAYGSSVSGSTAPVAIVTR